MTVPADFDMDAVARLLDRLKVVNRIFFWYEGMDCGRRDGHALRHEQSGVEGSAGPRT
jgi:hypothetical protein